MLKHWQFHQEETFGYSYKGYHQLAKASNDVSKRCQDVRPQQYMLV